ncbi:MAG: hypothetical protein V1661_03595 [bacterium]
MKNEQGETLLIRREKMIYWRLLLLGSMVPLAVSIALFTAAWASSGVAEKTRLSFGAGAFLSLASALAISAHALMFYKMYKIYRNWDTFSLFMLVVSTGLLIFGLYKVVKNAKIGGKL